MNHTEKIGYRHRQEYPIDIKKTTQLMIRKRDKQGVVSEARTLHTDMRRRRRSSRLKVVVGYPQWGGRTLVSGEQPPSQSSGVALLALFLPWRLGLQNFVFILWTPQWTDTELILCLQV